MRRFFNRRRGLCISVYKSMHDRHSNLFTISIQLCSIVSHIYSSSEKSTHCCLSCRSSHWNPTGLLAQYYHTILPRVMMMQASPVFSYKSTTDSNVTIVIPLVQVYLLIIMVQVFLLIIMLQVCLFIMVQVYLFIMVQVYLLIIMVQVCLFIMVQVYLLIIMVQVCLFIMVQVYLLIIMVQV